MSSDKTVGMDTTSESGVDLKANALDDFVMSMVKKPLYAIHPRRMNRTVTMWRGAVTIKLEDSLPAVLNVFHSENILGAPVITSNGRFYGFIDTFDIVRFLMRLFPKDADISKESLTEFFQKEEKAAKTSMRELLDFVHPNRDWKDYRQHATIPKDFSFFFAFETMIRMGRKRMAVLDENQQVFSIVTQSMLLGWLYNNMEETLKPIKDIPVRQIPNSEKHVLTIKETDPTMEAFRLMVEKRVHGLAVVDARGEITEAISIRDVRGINPTAEDFLKLWRPVRTFKQEFRAKFPTKTPTFTDLYLLPSDTLKTAIIMMDEDRVHRLFIVRSALDKTPIGCITQTDVLKYVLELAGGPLYKDDEEEDVVEAAAPAPAPASKPQVPSAPSASPKTKPGTAPVTKPATLTGAAPEMASGAPQPKDQMSD